VEFVDFVEEVTVPEDVITSRKWVSISLGKESAVVQNVLTVLQEGSRLLLPGV
jgi:hypothetical protein